MSATRRATSAAFVAIALGGLSANAGSGLERAWIADLAAAPAGESLRVSYRIEAGLPDDVVERLHSGADIVYRHRIEVIHPRGGLLPTKVLERRVVETRATFDALTRQYRLSRRTRDDGAGEPEERVTAELSEVDAWMTSIRTSVPGVDRAKRPRARVRVRANLGRKFVLLLFPSHHSASAEVEIFAP